MLKYTQLKIVPRLLKAAETLINLSIPGKNLQELPEHRVLPAQVHAVPALGRGGLLQVRGNLRAAAPLEGLPEAALSIHKGKSRPKLITSNGSCHRCNSDDTYDGGGGDNDKRVDDGRTSVGRGSRINVSAKRTQTELRAAGTQQMGIREGAVPFEVAEITEFLVSWAIEVV